MKKRQIWGIIIAIILIAGYYAFDYITNESFTSDINTSAEITAADDTAIEYTFRTEKQLIEHYEKHGIEMGFSSAEEYLKAANRVVNSDKALHKLEKEDNDDVYYIEDTNEFVVVSGKGYIRTYFNPSDGINYFNRQ